MQAGHSILTKVPHNPFTSPCPEHEVPINSLNHRDSDCLLDLEYLGTPTLAYISFDYYKLNIPKLITYNFP